MFSRRQIPDGEKKELVDIFILSLVALACPLVLPVVIQKLDDEKEDKQE